MSVRCTALFLVVALSSCTGNEKRPTEAVKRSHDTPKKSEPAQPAIAVLPPDQCHVFADEQLVIPAYLKDGMGGVMVTRVTKPCVTRDGQRGVQKDTEWMAMGVPCTGGRGPIQITGKNYNPLMLGFVMSTDCAVSPSSIERVRDLAKSIGLSADNKLLAYNPLSIQYWEVDGFTDYDAGDRIELRSQNAIRTFWNDFKAGSKKLHVRVYGRENAWVQDDNVFMAEGDLVFQQPMHFRFDVTKTRVLLRDEVTKLREKCENIKPRRSCDVF